MINYSENNVITLVGTIASERVFSHEVYGEGFYSFDVEVPRLSDNNDIIPVTVSERILTDEFTIGKKVVIDGQAFKGFDEDFITVNPYLGTDGIKPFADVCKEEKKGMFILVKTSNPSSGEFQDRLIDGKPLYEHVAKKVVEWGADVMGDSYSYIGAVVGATYPEMGKVLRELMPKSYILVPGYGAQGGKGKDLVHFFNKDGLGAIVNSSRGIIAAYKQDKYSQFGSEAYADASRQAVLDMKEDLKQAIR